jgi:hypothetical protein
MQVFQLIEVEGHGLSRRRIANPIENSGLRYMRARQNHLALGNWKSQRHAFTMITFSFGRAFSIHAGTPFLKFGE